MSLNFKHNPEKNIFYRIWDHTAFGLCPHIGKREKTPRNIVEKGGDAVLWTVGLVPRAIKALVKSFQDPRVVTIVLTAFALLAASLIFYPLTTITVTKVAFTTAIHLIKHIPLWAVKFSAYLATCATIIGAGLRAGGRFNNKELMKDYYNLPDYPKNPSRLYSFEIAAMQKV